MLLFRGNVSRGVEDAASYGGYRYPSPEHCALPAVLPRSSGETQLPQRSHLCVVGFSCMDTARLFVHGSPFYPSRSKGQWHLNEFVKAAAAAATAASYPSPAPSAFHSPAAFLSAAFISYCGLHDILFSGRVCWH